MIEEIGVVKQVEGGQIIVQTQMKNACQACSQKAACGTGVIARAVANKTSDFVFHSGKPDAALPLSEHVANMGHESAAEKNVDSMVNTNNHFVPGEQVRLGIQEESLLAASAMMYIVPLVGLIMSALIGQFLFPQLGLIGEGWVIGFTAIGVYLTFKLVKMWTRKQCKRQFEPVLLGKLTLDKLENPRTHTP